MLVEAFRQVSVGTLSLDQRIEVLDTDKVIGSGVLKELRASLAPTLDDLLLLTMSISDNTAANMVIDRVGIENVNALMVRLGLKQTQLTGKILIDQTHKTETDTGKAERSPTTPRDLARLLTLIERCDPSVGIHAENC